jgi:hypothetical protein
MQNKSSREAKARELIDLCLKSYKSIHELRTLHKTSHVTLPKLTDKECQNIAVNYPLGWRDVRSVFPEA